MPLGELVGRGASSEVYGWTAETVVKLFEPEFESLAAGELERTRAVHAKMRPVGACTSRSWSRAGPG